MIKKGALVDKTRNRGGVPPDAAQRKSALCRVRDTRYVARRQYRLTVHFFWVVIPRLKTLFDGSC
jgi:hypothetical protein